MSHMFPTRTFANTTLQQEPDFSTSLFVFGYIDGVKNPPITDFHLQLSIPSYLQLPNCYVPKSEPIFLQNGQDSILISPKNYLTLDYFTIQTKIQFNPSNGKVSPQEGDPYRIESRKLVNGKGGRPRIKSKHYIYLKFRCPMFLCFCIPNFLCSFWKFPQRSETYPRNQSSMLQKSKTSKNSKQKQSVGGKF